MPKSASKDERMPGIKLWLSAVRSDHACVRHSERFFGWKQVHSAQHHHRETAKNQGHTVADEPFGGIVRHELLPVLGHICLDRFHLDDMALYGSCAHIWRVVESRGFLERCLSDDQRHLLQHLSNTFYHVTVDALLRCEPWQ